MHKAAALAQLTREGKIGFIKAIRTNTRNDGEVMREWLSPPPPVPDFSYMGLKEAKDLTDLIDPSMPSDY
jgi:hypothetical protein